MLWGVYINLRRGTDGDANLHEIYLESAANIYSTKLLEATVPNAHKKLWKMGCMAAKSYLLTDHNGAD